MKNTFYKLSHWGMALLLCSGFCLSACSDDDDIVSVDLRYEEVGQNTVNDAYTIDAKGTKTIQLRIKSDHPWKVYGTQDWFTVSPSEGEPGEANIVTITCQENTKLDDRMDEINIQSDYWIGKTFKICQKGIAYLKAEAAETGLNGQKDAGTAVFHIESNQPWSVQITEGEQWLQVTKNTTGGKEYENTTTPVTLSYKTNKGEERTGKITIYDRKKDEETKVHVMLTQNGIVMQPQVPEIGYFKQVDPKAHTLKVQVCSNDKWYITKGNEKDIWYQFVGETHFEGDAEVTIALDENKGDAIRNADILIKNEFEGDAEEITKSFRIRQAFEPKEQIVLMNAGGIGSWENEGVTAGDNETFFDANQCIKKAGFKPGTFKLHIKSMKSAKSHPYMALTYMYASQHPSGKLHEMSIEYNSGANTYWCFNTPWGFARPQVNAWFTKKYGKLDHTQEHTLELRLTKYDKYVKTIWVYDGNLAHSHIADGNNTHKSEINGISQSTEYVQPYKSTMTVRIGCSAGGGATFDWFSYTPNVDWDE
ncbi:hypothetical protein EVA_04209 [gut metagenome]|uniref:BACON domain-containing protein n=1 Tax=gut metagenome TaxID=749906 RepID=J9GK54_9ZZZZ